ncbi:hypothetical protein [Ensifer sp. OTU672]
MMTAGYNRGRGLAQIAGRVNAKFGFVGTPDKAAEMGVALRILFDGMAGGLFTGRKLKDYAAADGYRYAASRAIINGDVKANGTRIEKYGRAYEAALKAAGYVAGLAQPIARAATGFWAALGRFLLCAHKGRREMTVWIRIALYMIAG